MGKSLLPKNNQQSIYFSRADASELFGTFSKHAFELEGKKWPSVEHYFQAMKFEDKNHQEKIRQTTNSKQARKLGRSRSKKIRSDWKNVKSVFMTRAFYTKCRTYPDITEALLQTESRKLVENSQYDYFWGCGRDRRGENMYGQVLMNVRDKLREEVRG